ncbi:sphingolipid delta(4)-desaturase DES1-like [Saccoglossus kowalevskii]|uniref:sphingolipid 4-desaturase n=1 Tax=Saccoglossus kowalevskii TaxID=10224 RepID=A0ABM0GSL9_SACKO|nr:PREDICTED: sphingolipid delta(4)-desaturase DES1-like [Saccoglossus kowalevskii]
MGASVTRDEFEWVYTEQPHAVRRREMLAKYPQIKKLMGHDTAIVKYVFLVVALQIFACWLLQSASWGTIIIIAYVFGGTMNKCMQAAMHEISHNLAFGHSRPMWNRHLGIISNLPLGVPAFISFKKYHTEHHRYLAMDELDPDIPSELECKLFRNTFTKIIFVLLLPFTYSLRPFIRRPRPISIYEIYNAVAAISCDALLYYMWGFKPVAYLVISTILGGGIHPLGAHAIAEHYLFQKGFETYSYYGPLNMLTFNLGYHWEHHDFPNIPYTRLPQLQKIAPEYYVNQPKVSSWPGTIWKFIFDPELGPYARIKRPRGNVNPDKYRDD